MKQTSDTLEDVLSSSPAYMDSMDDLYSMKMGQVIQRLKGGYRLMSFKMFSINREAFMGLLSTAITYIVVLLQFKTTEIPLEGG